MISVSDSNSNNNSNNDKQVWLITGSTSGTGLALVEAVLELGHSVVGTSRDIKKWDKLENLKNNKNFLGIQLDLVNEKSVKESIALVIEHFGTITHLVNNAGYGKVGAIEEASDAENRELMDCLYFGPLNLVRAVLPHMREKKHGYIFNVSSVAGIKGYPRFGSYSGAKYAILGATESLAADVKSFGIKVASIVIGYFETGFQNANEYTKTLIPEYGTKALWESITAYYMTARGGDPKKFAKIVIEYANANEIPYNIFMCAGTFDITQGKVKEIQEQLDSQKLKGSDVNHN